MIFFKADSIHDLIRIPLQTVLQSSTQEAEAVNRVTNYFFIAAAAMLLVVVALTTFIIIRFRKGKEADTEKKKVNPKWEFAMIGVPTALVGIFLYLSITTMSQVQASPEGHQPDVTITGHQWWWQATYADTSIVAANEIHLPAGKKILLQLHTADVIHDWWVPQLGIKKDMIPNEDNYLWLTIKQPGEYYGICSEFCGDQHAHMRIKVIAQTEAEYTNWLMLQKQPAESKPEFAQGRALFTSKTCGNCHNIKGTEANGQSGPDLTHLASRQTLLAGMLPNNIDNLKSWISHPQTVKPGAHMPDFLLPDSSVNTLSLYLNSLQ